MAKTVMIKKKGKKPIKFKEGGLHRTTGTPAGQKIPASKMRAAKAGRYGKLGKKQANMATGLLAAGRKTVTKNRVRKRQVKR